MSYRIIKLKRMFLKAAGLTIGEHYHYLKVRDGILYYKGMETDFTVNKE